MLKQTPLNAAHRAAGAKMVDFGGWDMPLHYGSQLEEHHKVRSDAGMFDVSHMRVVDLTAKARAIFCASCSPTMSTSSPCPARRSIPAC